MDALATALSGMQASTLGLDVAAANVANADTPVYAAYQELLAADPFGGVDAAVARDAPPPNLPGLAADEQPSGTDLLSSLVEADAAPLAYDASARIVSARRRMDQSLFDLLG